MHRIPYGHVTMPGLNDSTRQPYPILGGPSPRKCITSVTMKFPIVRHLYTWAMEFHKVRVSFCSEFALNSGQSCVTSCNSVLVVTLVVDFRVVLNTQLGV